MPTGEYSETLPCGGRLTVRGVRWDINYYFPGKDRRHKGQSICIHMKDVDRYIEAYAENWNEYRSLKKTVPPGGDFSKAGKMGMTIRLGKFARGVCLQGYHMPLASKEDVIKMIESYRYAKRRASQVQDMLAMLGDTR